MRISLQTIKKIGILFLAWGVVSLSPPGRVWSQESGGAALPGTTDNHPATDLSNLSLESLAGLNVVVTSSAKKAESLRDATSAIYVITSDDIRRSGTRHLANLLRMVPGLLVVRVTASQWAITARGFNSLYNNKMLVLVDGRSAYQTEYGGVNWDELDLLLEDIDRIEVIRGPGGTLWGSNAVNGIINIITKDSKVTQGVYATSLTGSGGSNRGALRYGGKVTDDLYYRLYAKTQDQGPFQDPGGDSNQDNWTSQRAGFRADWHPEKDDLTLEGDYQIGNIFMPGGDFTAATLQQTSSVDRSVDRDADILAHWTHHFSESSEGELKVYYDHIFLQTFMGQNVLMDTLDAELQHRFPLNDWNEVTWGLDFRNVMDDYPNPISSYMTPGSASLDTYGAFLQDKLTLVADHLYLTAGAKLENNPYTGEEWQPSGRLLWTPDKTNSLWAAVSRVVRVPSRSEEDVDFFLNGQTANFGMGPVTLYSALLGDPGLKVEDIVSYEAGYRTNPLPGVSLDLAGFCDRYYSVITTGFNVLSYPNFPPTPIGGYYAAFGQAYNADGGVIYGAELSLKCDLADPLQASLAYTYNGYDSILNSVSNIFSGNPPPHNIVAGQMSLTPAKDWEFNTSLYWVDGTYINDPTGQFAGVVQPFVVWDLGVTWKAGKSWELSVWGKDLEGSHAEASSFLNDSQPSPAVFGQLAARY